MRVLKTSSGNTIVYHYDKEGRVISETDSNGNLISEFVYANGKLVAKLLPATLYFYHTDPAGTPLAMTDVGGSVVWRADYLPFGEENIISGTLENNYKFVGKENDKETGLYYFGARYMEAMIGRFISPDVVGPVDPTTGKVIKKLINNPQGLNCYAYALNNPYRYIDPDGKWPAPIHAASIQRVLLNDLSMRNRLILVGRQYSMDSLREYSNPNLHALRNPGQDPVDAWRIANSFVRDSIEIARELESRDQHTEALEHLGNAIHIMNETTSPTHSGFQEDPRGARNSATHAFGESTDPRAGSALDATTRRAWELFKSREPVPKEVLPRP